MSSILVGQPSSGGLTRRRLRSAWAARCTSATGHRTSLASLFCFIFYLFHEPLLLARRVGSWYPSHRWIDNGRAGGKTVDAAE